MQILTDNRRLLAFLLFGAAFLLMIGEPAMAETSSLRLPLPDPLPHVRVLTLLVALHLLGLCFGLGGATMLDFWILRWMRWGSLPAEIARTFQFISGAVAIGLGLLWLSGIGFLALYGLESPEKFQNPKLWAKILVVSVLTINGMIIHVFVLPEVLRNVSRPLLDGVSPGMTAIFLASGAVSAVSWYTAFAFGIFREFNDHVAFGLLIVLWLGAAVAATLAASLLWNRLRCRNRKTAALAPAGISPAE